MTEPAIDLGIAMAIVSSFRERAIGDDMVVFGEVGLSGEVRAVSFAEQRIAEAAKLGFKRAVIPAVCKDKIGKITGIKVIPVSNLSEAIELI